MKQDNITKDIQNSYLASDTPKDINNEWFNIKSEFDKKL